jgi:hypothetical protein
MNGERVKIKNSPSGYWIKCCALRTQSSNEVTINNNYSTPFPPNFAWVNLPVGKNVDSAS